MLFRSKDLVETPQMTPSKSSDGWLGFVDKYWGVALVPSSAQPFQPRFSYLSDNNNPRYQVDFVSDALTVPAGGSATVENHVFAGAKEVGVIDAYEKALDIRQFDLLIDWGWFYFVTKPMFFVMDYIYRLVGNFGIAILIVTVLVKLAFFPLANKSYASMAKMKAVQPQMMALRER